MLLVLCACSTGSMSTTRHLNDGIEWTSVCYEVLEGKDENISVELKDTQKLVVKCPNEELELKITLRSAVGDKKVTIFSVIYNIDQEYEGSFYDE